MSKIRWGRVAAISMLISTVLLVAGLSYWHKTEAARKLQATEEFNQRFEDKLNAPIEVVRQNILESYVGAKGMQELQKNFLFNVIVAGPEKQAIIAASKGDFRFLGWATSLGPLPPDPPRNISNRLTVYPGIEESTATVIPAKPYGIECLSSVEVVGVASTCEPEPIVYGHVMWDYNEALLKLAPANIRAVCHLDTKVMAEIMTSKIRRQSVWAAALRRQQAAQQSR